MLYGLKVMTDWRWVSEIVRSFEMVEVHVSWLGVCHTSVFCPSEYNRTSVGKRDVMRLEV